MFSFFSLFFDFSVLVKYQVGIVYGRTIKVEPFDNLHRTYGL